MGSRLLKFILPFAALSACAGQSFTNTFKLSIDGDSITAGSGGATHAWPYYLSNQLANVSGWTWGTNASTGGSSTLDLSNRYTAALYPHRTNGLAFIYSGFNDGAYNGSVIFQRLSNYWTQAKSDGFKVVAFKITYDYPDAVGNANYSNANAMIATSTIPDLVINTEELWTPGSATYLSDLIHPNDLGHQAIASNVFSRLDALMTHRISVSVSTIRCGALQ